MPFGPITTGGLPFGATGGGLLFGPVPGAGGGSGKRGACAISEMVGILWPPVFPVPTGRRAISDDLATLWPAAATGALATAVDVGTWPKLPTLEILPPKEPEEKWAYAPVGVRVDPRAVRPRVMVRRLARKEREDMTNSCLDRM
jgi:hypothetical protein